MPANLLLPFHEGAHSSIYAGSCGRLVSSEAGRFSFHDILFLHSLVLCTVVQPVYDALAELIDRAGTGDIGVLSGSGGAEMAIASGILNALWLAAAELAWQITETKPEPEAA